MRLRGLHWIRRARGSTAVLALLPAALLVPGAAAAAATAHSGAVPHAAQGFVSIPPPPVRATSGCTMSTTPLSTPYAPPGHVSPLDGVAYLGTGSGCVQNGLYSYWVRSGPLPLMTPLMVGTVLPGSSAPSTLINGQPAIPGTQDPAALFANWGGWDPGTGTGQPPAPAYGVPDGEMLPGQQQDPSPISSTQSCQAWVDSLGTGYPTPVPAVNNTPTPEATAGISNPGEPLGQAVVPCWSGPGSAPQLGGLWAPETALNTNLNQWPWPDYGPGPECEQFLEETATECLQQAEWDISWALHNYGSYPVAGSTLDGQPVLHPLPFQLPSNFLSLTYPEQLFVAIDTWRIDQGLYPMVALSSSVSSLAQQAAQVDQDPTSAPWPGNPALLQQMGLEPNGQLLFDGISSDWSLPSGMGGQYGGIWIGDDNAPLWNLIIWAYIDGWDPATNSALNLDCTSPSAQGCWGHLRNMMVLGATEIPSFLYPQQGEYQNGSLGLAAPPLNCSVEFCVMGIGYANQTDTSIWKGGSTAVSLAAWPLPPPASDISFTLAQELPYYPPDEQAMIEHTLWWANPQLSVVGAGELAGIPASTSTSTASTGTGTGGSSTGGTGGTSTGSGGSGATGTSTGGSSTSTGTGGTSTGTGGTSTGTGGTSTGTGGTGGTSTGGVGVGAGLNTGGGGAGGSSAPGAPGTVIPGAHPQGTLSGPVQQVVANPAGPGYWLVGANGSVQAEGGAPYLGSISQALPAGQAPHSSVVAMVPTPQGQGYWMVTAGGGVFSFGNAKFFGNPYTQGLTGLGGPHPLAAPIVGMVPAPGGQGYWMVAKDGGVFSFGDAPFLGNTYTQGLTGLGGPHPLAAPIVGMVPTANDQGYWLVGADGGVFTFGDAQFLGSVPGQLGPGRHLAAPIVGMVPAPSGQGYWLVGADGGVFTFGDAPFLGSLPGRGIQLPPGDPVVSITAAGNDQGYWVATAQGQVYGFGDAQVASAA